MSSAARGFIDRFRRRQGPNSHGYLAVDRTDAGTKLTKRVSGFFAVVRDFRFPRIRFNAGEKPILAHAVDGPINRSLVQAAPSQRRRRDTP